MIKRDFVSGAIQREYLRVIASAESPFQQQFPSVLPGSNVRALNEFGEDIAARVIVVEHLALQVSDFTREFNG